MGGCYLLADNYKVIYENLIKERYKEIINYLIDEEYFSRVSLISSHSLWNVEMLEYALELASRLGKMEILSHLMNQKQKSFRRVRKTFEL